jgi:hypothetical protein
MGGKSRWTEEEEEEEDEEEEKERKVSPYEEPYDGRTKVRA